MSVKVGLVTPSTLSHRTAEETIALGYLGTLLRQAGYNVRIVDGWLNCLTPEEIAMKLAIDTPPSLVGFSCYRSNLIQAEETLRCIRSQFGNIPAICGGYGPTFHDELFLKSGFTVAVSGEAEQIIIQLVSALLNGDELNSIPGIAFYQDGEIVRTQRTEPVIDLDTILFPARDTIQSAIAQKNFIHVCTSRGCEAHCSFCSIFAFALGASRKRRWRQRGVLNIVDEIRYLYEQFGVMHFKFVDDSFIEPPRDETWTDAFLNEITKHNLSIKFRTQVRADRLTPIIVQNLKQAGWHSTSVGVENASSTALRRMAKSASIADNLAALEMLEQNGIYVQMGMILFDPETTMDELRENLEFLKSHRWPVTKGIFTEMFAAEGTAFTRKLHSRGMLSQSTQTQNYVYTVQDHQAQRVYAMLKAWHRSHSVVYDWVIDSLTAPKVLPDVGYSKVHSLVQRLQTLDLLFFEHALERASSTAHEDTDIEYVRNAIIRLQRAFTEIEAAINILYAAYGLTYNAVPNPFLSS